MATFWAKSTKNAKIALDTQSYAKDAFRLSVEIVKRRMHLKFCGQSFDKQAESYLYMQFRKNAYLHLLPLGSS